ncbi:MAG: hypothetical protein ACI8R4_002006 [Paracoccaceae bacterium]|jgi:hypothetical protein
MSDGVQETGIKHRIVWGVLLTAVIGALPFTMVMTPPSDPTALVFW